MECVGWMASFCLAFCGLPQAIRSIKEGHSKGLSRLFMWMWSVGEALMIIYTIWKIGLNGPIHFNLFINLVCCSIIMYYLYFPRRSN